MRISRRLLIIVCLTVMEVSITVWSALEIAKGGKFHQLNFLHLKYDLEFTQLIDKYESGQLIDIQELEPVIFFIKEQPLACLDLVNSVDIAIMKAIGTHSALGLCEKDIDDANVLLAQIEQYSRNEISRSVLLDHMKYASEQFSQNSTEFEQPIEETVSFILRTLIPSIIVISLFNIALISYLARAISLSIRKVINLLSGNTEDAKEITVNNIHPKIPVELQELLETARHRIKQDLMNIETSAELKEIVKQQTKSLIEANDELTQFAYRASHDLKAPLSSSKSLSEFIVSDIDDNDLDEAKSNARKIYQQLDKLERLVTDILSLTKAELAEDQLQEIDFEEVLGEIEGRISWLMEENNCTLSSEISLSKPLVAEKARVVQILENLISNGVKYSSPDRPSYVKLTVSETDKGICVKIEDNGVGIPKDHWSDVFLMFKRFHPERADGSGLGLAIVKKHLDYWGGSIDFESSDGGTIFDISLQREPRAAA